MGFNPARVKSGRPAVFAAALFIAQQACFAQTPQELALQYASVQRTFLKENFEETITLSQSFILENPAAAEIPRVWLWLVLSLDKLQQSNEALRELNRLKDRLPKQDPLWPEILFWEGDISRRALNVIRAKVTFERLLDRYPDSSWSLQAQLGIGLIDLHQQDFDSALSHFKQVALREQASPAGRDARLFQGVCLMQLKRFAEAEAVFRPLLEEIKEPANMAQTAFYLGESLSSQNRFDEAVAVYQKAIAVKSAPHWVAPAQFGLGWAYYRLDKCQESTKQFDAFLRSGVAHHQTEAWFAEGSCLLKLGQEDDAVSLFERVLIRNREHPLAMDSGLIIVDIYRRQGRSALAFDLLQRLLERPSEPASRAQVQLRLASLNLEEGRPNQAQSLYEAVSKSHDPALQQAALSGLGDVKMFFGDLNSARKLYTEVIKKSPDSSVARYANYQLGRIAMQEGHFSEAAATFQQLAASDESNMADDARLALALTYLNQADEALAYSTLEAIRKRQSGSQAASRAAYYLALIAAAKNDFPQAKKLCQETINKVPQADEALDARLLIADIIAQTGSRREAIQWLKGHFNKSANLPARQRGKVAKRLGDLSRDERQYAQAQLWYDEAAQLLPALRAEMIYRIATCYEEAGDTALAMSWYRQIGQAPWKVRGLMAMAKLYEREERFKDARDVYEQLSREEAPEAKVAEERLEELKALTHSKEKS